MQELSATRQRPGQKATKLQEFKLAELEAAGAYVCVATSSVEVRNLLIAIDTRLASS